MFFDFLYPMIDSEYLIIMSVKIGIFAGLVTTVVGMVLGFVGFTDLNLGRYFGCLLTGRSSGPINFIAGFALHIIASALLIFGYEGAFLGLKMLKMPLALNVKTYILFGMVHACISGSLLLITDKINRCVRAKSIKAMGFMASNYGTNACIAFIAVHLLYGLICCQLFVKVAMKSLFDNAAKTIVVDAAQSIFTHLVHL